MRVMAAILIFAGLVLVVPAPGDAQENPMTFFLTSQGPGNGGNLGGLAGADAHCQMLAETVDEGDRTWRAYLSTQGSNAVNARDRIGSGPWYNAAGALIGNNVDELHGLGHRFNSMTVLDEGGRRIPGSGYAPNRHDILTGSTEDGTAYSVAKT